MNNEELNKYFELDPSIPNGLRWKSWVRHVGSEPAGHLDKAKKYYRVVLKGVTYKNEDIVEALKKGTDYNRKMGKRLQLELLTKKNQDLKASFEEACFLIVKMKVAFDSVMEENEKLKEQLECKIPSRHSKH